MSFCGTQWEVITTYQNTSDLSSCFEIILLSTLPFLVATIFLVYRLILITPRQPPLHSISEDDDTASTLLLHPAHLTRVILNALLSGAPIIYVLLRMVPAESWPLLSRYEYLWIGQGVAWVIVLAVSLKEIRCNRRIGNAVKLYYAVYFVVMTIRLRSIILSLMSPDSYRKLDADEFALVDAVFFLLMYALFMVNLLLVLWAWCTGNDVADDYKIYYQSSGRRKSRRLLTEEEEDLLTNVDPLDAKDEDVANESPEDKANFLSILTFWWMNPLILTGFKRPLQESDLSKLQIGETCKYLSKKFAFYWRNQQRKYLKKIPSGYTVLRTSDASEHSDVFAEVTREKPSLFLALVRSFGGTFIFAALFKVVQDTMVFVGPQVLERVVSFVSPGNTEPQSTGYVYAILLIGASWIQSLNLHQYFHRCFRVGMRVRAALTLAIYEKALKLSTSSRGEKSVGDIVNLMSIDSQRIQDLMPYLHMIWSAPFQISISIYLLWQQIGIASLAGLAVMFLLIPLNIYLSKFMKSKQEVLMKVRDERVKVTNEVFSNMKVIKLYAWEESFGTKIRKIREEELSLLRKYQVLEATQSLFWGSSPVLIAVAAFSTYAAMGKELDPAKAFTTVTLFNILRFPVGMLPYITNGIIEASISMRRIETFLLSKEIEDSDKPDTSPLSSIPGVLISNADFSWDDDGKTMALHDVNIKINPGELVAVVGRTGAGKTAFLSAILGDLKKVDGKCIVGGSMAYTSQKPWIQNATVSENITFGRKLDINWFKSVVHACALGPDLKILPNKQHTEIGERGINLSGGQKHRIALARAVYQRADVYLFDDPLSAVDMHVSRHIFQECIAGLLHNTTRILVTHQANVFPFVDKIIFIENGRIAAAGTYDELTAHSDEFNTFLAQIQLEDEDEGKEAVFRIPLGGDEKDISLEDVDVEQPTDDLPGERHTSDSDLASIHSDASGDEASRAKLIEEEKREVGHVSWNVYSSYIKACGGWYVGFGLFSGLLLWMASDLATSRWLAHWSDSVSSSDHSSFWFLAIYVALAMSVLVWLYVSLIFFVFATVRAAKVLHERLIDSLLRANMSFFDTTPLGRILNRFSKDQYVIDENLFDALFSYIRQVFSVLGIFLAICSVTPIFAVLLLPLSFFYSKIQDYYIASSRELKRLDSVLRSPIFSHFSETLDGVSTIRAFGAQSRFIHTNEHRVDKSLRAYYPSVAANRWLALRLEFVGSVVVGGAALFAIVYKSKIDPSLAGLSISYALMITQTLNWMVRMSSERETNIVSVERIQDYAQVDYEASLVIEGHRPPPDWPTKGEIIMKDIRLRYRPGLDFVLKGLSCHISPSDRVGIVGRTGAGKSSFFLALLRLVEPASGSIFIDGISVLDIGLHDLRSKVSIIPQDPVLFTGSLRFNLDPFGEHSDADIFEALQLAHLGKHVESLEGRLDHQVLEGGSNFSGGQKQLICLARALLRKSRIILLDEATSSVSRDIDNLIQETIRVQFAGCTVLTIAHRLETVMDNDRIFVMDGGRIAEEGCPQELMRESHSLFYGLVESMKIAAS